MKTLNKIWIVETCIPHEQDTRHGVFATKELAEAFKNTLDRYTQCDTYVTEEIILDSL